MTAVVIETETGGRRWTLVDIVENLYLHLARFLYGAWISPYVWVIFGLMAMAQTPQASWQTWVRNILVVVFLANSGRLWEWHNATRKAHLKSGASS